MGQWKAGDHHVRSQQGRWDDARYGNADLTGEGFVDMGDFGEMSREWLSTGEGLASDLDGSGVVDVGDLAILAMQWLRPGKVLGKWTYDGYMSLAIDAGEIGAGWGAELWPHGKRINIGVYGGTVEASFSGQLDGNVADINEDGRVDLKDMRRVSEQWGIMGEPVAGDISRDGWVNLADIIVLAENWLWQQE
jgi:hypothetical protein